MMIGRHLLVPVKKHRLTGGVFRWPRRAILASRQQADALPLGQLAGDLKRMGLSSAVQNDLGPAAVRVHRDAGIKENEGYRLTISPAGVEIAAATDAGAFYAVQTLRQLLAIHGRALPCCVIEDWPDFRRRGVYHDCSRGKVPTVETLKALVDRLASWKINELQLYIENVFKFRRHPAVWRGFDPFTPEEILDLQAYCKTRHMRLVGSLASFGHMEKILRLKQYRHLLEVDDGSPWPASTLCPTDPRSIKFVEELYEEFVPLFEAGDFNACCDETSDFDKGRSRRRSKAMATERRRRAQRIGSPRVYLEFLLKIYRLCRKFGKRMNVWADIVLKHPGLLKELPRDIVMLNWEYESAGPRITRTAEIARAGLPFMVCPGTSAWLTHGSRLANAIENVAQFAAQGRRWGAEGLLNTDWGDLGHRNFLGVSLHGFAHGAAHSWHGRAVDDKTFTETFCFHAFGQGDNRLAKGLRLLGESYRVCCDQYYNSSALYRALVEPLVGSTNAPDSRINQTKTAGLRKVIENLSSQRLWPAADSGMDRFETLALQEFALAGRMDVLAARRALAAKKIRTGKRVSKGELLRLADEMRQLSHDFSRLWMARNKPSRLKDNLAAFAEAESESRRLAKIKPRHRATEKQSKKY